jgi:hypothetical protein
LLDRLIGEGLDEEALAGAGRSKQEHVAPFADEPAGRQIEDLFFVNRGMIERP